MENSLYRRFKKGLTDIFKTDDFGLPEECALWEKAAKLYTLSDRFEYADIVEWMDRIYNAPLHIIYKSVDNNYLLLEHYQVLPTNLIRQTLLDTDKKNQENEFVSIFSGGRSVDNIQRFMTSETEPGFMKDPATRNTILNLEEKIHNLPQKLSNKDIFRKYGESDFTIGTVEHYPLKDRDGDFWGIYAVGPKCDLPEQLIGKTDRLSLHLSEWVATINESKKDKKVDYVNRWTNAMGPLGVGEFNLETTAAFLLGYLSNRKELSGIGLFEVGAGWITKIADFKLAPELIDAISQLDGDKLKKMQKKESALQEIIVTVVEETVAKNSGVISFRMGDRIAFLLYLVPDDVKEKLQDSDPDIQLIIRALVDLLNFRSAHNQIAGSMVDTYFELQRGLEKRRPKTKYHTQRVIALAKSFSEAFGLDINEKEELIKTAKLHDIGYVGAWIWSSRRNISDDIEHPSIGRKMVERLPLKKVVKDGIATHHERVDGNGTPLGVSGDDIPWTGKIIGLAEFVSEFIEEHQAKAKEGTTDETKKNDRIEQLSEELINRAESQFDMMLMPTMLELIQDYGWEKLCLLGTREK